MRQYKTPLLIQILVYSILSFLAFQIIGLSNKDGLSSWFMLGSFFCFGVFTVVWTRNKIRRNREIIEFILKQTRELKEVTDRYQNIVDNTSEWYWEISKEGKYTYCVGDVEGIIGYKPEKMVGTRFDNVMMPESDESYRVKSRIHQILQREGPFRRLEYWTWDRDGDLVFLHVDGDPILDIDGTFLGFRGLTKIYDRKSIEEYNESFESFDRQSAA